MSNNGTENVTGDLTPEQLAALDKVDLDDIRAAIGGVNFSKVSVEEAVWLMVLLQHRTLWPDKNRPERTIVVKARNTLDADAGCPWCGGCAERNLIVMVPPEPGTKEGDGVQ